MKDYDHKIRDKELRNYWETNGIYKFRENDEKRAIFSIDTPPPTVSGSLHIGHVFSYTQAEIIARYKRMQGYNVFYPFGFDDNGLPTERLTEREHKCRAGDMERSEFTKLCESTTEKYEKEFKELWQSLGISADWSLEYRTVSPLSKKISQRSFLELVKTGKAYMKTSPVLWCSECRTSIAQAELDTAECTTTFNYMYFETDTGNIPVATTRPELLYGNVALFVHPEDERYQKFIGKMAKVPLYDFYIPVIAEETVAIDKGSGAVMCATYGDSADAEWAEKHKLPYKEVILPNGRISEKVPYIGGLKIKEARAEIIKLLKEKGLIFKEEEITHTVAVHERCGKETELIPSQQWYIDVLSEKERFLKAADEINWHPSFMKERYVTWVENLKWDWCISRQRYFGVPIPVWYCKNCGNPIFPNENELPVDPTESLPHKKCACGCEDFIPETAVLDTWATSSVTPLINAHKNEENDISRKILPMSMRSQAHEIIRTWAFYTIVKSLYHTGRIPWDNIMISGFVLAKPGEKISKSKNNASASPKALIETYSADALRYWAANSKLGTDTFFSSDELKASKRFLTKLINAAKFCELQLKSFTKPERLDKNTLLPLDRWILERLSETTERCKNLLDEYEIGQARHEIDKFFWSDFCDNYIELVKERLYQPEKYGDIPHLSAQTALYFAFLGIIKLYAIYVPFITEHIYLELFKECESEISLHLCLWESDEGDELYISLGEAVKAAVSDARKYKTENKLSMKEPMDNLEIRAKKELIPLINESLGDIKACTGAKNIAIIPIDEH